MNRRLVYLVGPSGAGKDSLLQWLVQHPPAHTRLHLARRTVTRPAKVGTDGDEAVDASAFAALLQANAFVMHWSANGLQYGIREREFAALATEGWVLVSGSRAHLPLAQLSYPGLSAVHVHASADVLRLRLSARQRESSTEVEARLRRALAFDASADAFYLSNNEDLESAGQRLKAHLFSQAVVPCVTNAPDRLGRKVT
ncbi:MAG: phosphonate metabolism protein/1,5-bisphosphokinase (PRPP-forming) PhnN [Hydrogenophaga sp.]|uniref:phosphonate metabolism protein/1,5-bisphosphokinase (PRPP-forming) PhnN n=1 Tax=Hydrogenophaga sp. TaxID=1904254 RepID=UPI002ABCECA4|nr:phosphonate metabolism protein/1,5-bisphosphokinase (PRPP-forming) PhnN [Hydrogenophaga sp.]MDZ4100162.1 phosphonate metabolism protein/1,5-bisphosphokinase (PRPP-forming) PhnN [Hydrogenophaga sp.]